MDGYIKLYRRIEDYPVLMCEEFDKYHAFLWMVERANFVDTRISFNGRYKVLKRGQFITSIRKLELVFGWSKKRVRVFLDDLQTAGLIKTVRNTNGSIITICNYDMFQFGGDPAQGHTECTTGGTTQPIANTGFQPKQGTLNTQQKGTGHAKGTTKPLAITGVQPKQGTRTVPSINKYIKGGVSSSRPFEGRGNDSTNKKGVAWVDCVPDWRDVKDTMTHEKYMYLASRYQLEHITGLTMDKIFELEDYCQEYERNALATKIDSGKW